ncbi:hypothetical protein CRG98_028734 [Punica granatum]|uniref:Uncharacterized protein n=1 Tax=Punica granatum TaxID=22663 RepID=A0A2I0J3R8_PUNGR|nr:hypothetical protein CRG98_028734 [Punica granatum]
MTMSIPTSLDGVTHYGNLEVNFNRGGPSVRRLSSCVGTNFTGDAPVYVAWKCLSWVDDVRGGLGVNVERECSGLHRRCDSCKCRDGARYRAGADAVNAGPEPDEGPKPNVVNAGPKPDAEPKPKSRAEAQCGAEAQ